MKKTIHLGDNTKSNYIEILEEEQKQIDPPMEYTNTGNGYIERVASILSLHF